ncbi:MAG: c-type cytochrome [Candidatus Acidiferrum sp.]
MGTLARLLTFVLVACIAAIVVMGVQDHREHISNRIVTGGNARRGKQLIVEKNCGSCHTIPGIYGAQGVVGPPLFFFSRRTFIAGELPNTPDNLVRWIRFPQSVNPNTAMPTLGLSEDQARDVVAYLYTLR